MSRYSKTPFVAAVLVLALALGAVAAKKRLDNLWVIEPSVENFRAAPNGSKLGTLLKGTEIEQIGQDGEWVRFRVEGWVWGPSLEGFEAEEEEAEQASAAEPVSPLHDVLPRLKEMVNDKYGRFYGVDFDEDLDRLRLRFRVRDLERAALERRIFVGTAAPPKSRSALPLMPPVLLMKEVLLAQLVQSLSPLLLPLLL